MSTNSNIEELVSRYLEGEMSELERLNFENRLVNNPAIQEEFQLQKDVLEGIRDYRKAELKARLNKINIPSPGITQYLGVKIAALVTITTMIGFGAYFIFVDNDKSPETPVATEQPLVVEKDVTRKEAPEIGEPIQDSAPQVSAEQKQGPVIKKAPESEVSKPEPESIQQEEEKKEVTQVPVPKVMRPDFVEDIAEENVDHKGDSFEVNANSLANINRLSESKVEVETVFDKKKDFHYKFYNRKLYLYGDFEQNPYEIIEYNANTVVADAGNRLYFLYYEGKYYRLESGQMKVAPLVELTDDELVNELELLRK